MPFILHNLTRVRTQPYVQAFCSGFSYTRPTFTIWTNYAIPDTWAGDQTLWRRWPMADSIGHQAWRVGAFEHFNSAWLNDGDYVPVISAFTFLPHLLNALGITWIQIRQFHIFRRHSRLLSGVAMVIPNVGMLNWWKILIVNTRRERFRLLILRLIGVARGASELPALIGGGELFMPASDWLVTAQTGWDNALSFASTGVQKIVLVGHSMNIFPTRPSFAFRFQLVRALVDVWKVTRWWNLRKNISTLTWYFRW